MRGMMQALSWSLQLPPTFRRHTEEESLNHDAMMMLVDPEELKMQKARP
jgi:hypothetical protein